MANKKEKTRNDANIIVNRLDVFAIQRTSQDIEKWRQAMRAAERQHNPLRKQLYDLYHDIMLDGHITSVIEKRKMAVTNTEIVYTNDKGERDETFDNILQSEEFTYMVGELLEAKFWGYTLIEFLELTLDSIKVELVDRRHVDPEKKVVKIHATDTTNGIPYNEPPECDWVISAGRDKDLGLLLKAAQYVIYKRGGFGDWSQFAELFGMPFREGVYDGHDPNMRAELINALKKMGGAPYIAVPEGAKINTHNSGAQSGSAVLYDKLVNACNKEISKIIVGQTMTTEDGSSKSQAEVHQDVEKQINLADKKYIKDILNTQFKRLWEARGIAVTGEFCFNEAEKLTSEQKLERDLKVSNKVPIDDDYWYDTYDIPKPDNYDELKAQQEEEREARKAAFEKSQGKAENKGGFPFF